MMEIENIIRYSPRAVGLMEIEKYSSSHKDWSCRAGLPPPAKADAWCAISPRASDWLTRRRGDGERLGARASRPHAALYGGAGVSPACCAVWVRGRLARMLRCLRVATQRHIAHSYSSSRKGCSC